MGFSVADINNVRAMCFPAGRGAGEAIVPLPGVTLVSWDSVEADKLFQVYVDGQWAGVTSGPGQRMLLVQCRDVHTSVIEVVAVEAEDKVTDFAASLDGFSTTDGGRVLLTWPQRGSLPLESKAVVHWDSGGGQIDYDNPLAIQDNWPNPAAKWGWGLDQFGEGDFGYSGTGAEGWGQGAFGRGEFGFDAQMLTWQSDELEAGTYGFAVRTTDGQGNFDAGETTVFEVSVDPLPAAPSLGIDSCNAGNDELVLNIG